MTAKEVMELSPVVPVVVLDDVEDALPLAEALLEGGIAVIEITLRTEAGLKAIEVISKSMPQMHVGAGTVMNASECRQAAARGAAFIFSPGISEELVKGAKECGITLIPGVATASEVMLSQNSGLTYCKLFPATLAGGVDMIKAFGGPFPSMHFCPTGGVNLDNLNDFLSLPNVTCVGGSWIVPKESIKRKAFQEITALCKEALNKININKVEA